MLREEQAQAAETVGAEEVPQHARAHDAHRALLQPAVLLAREHDDHLGPGGLGQRRASAAPMAADVRYWFSM